ncbi:MAG: phosphomethylpyrimidine synthase ThiC [Candidatus Hydrogenedentes bacterium]|nr:phosphomethylpyrimidine synthase ThiC [Candidatus Hydrogenedentota bacterium]
MGNLLSEYSKIEYVSFKSRWGVNLSIPTRVVYLSRELLPEGCALDFEPKYYLYETAGMLGKSQCVENSSGLQKVREEWLKKREEVEILDCNGHKVYTISKGKRGTQKYYAKRGIITPEMEYVAFRENLEVSLNRKWYEIFWGDVPEEIFQKHTLTPEIICEKVASGKVIIPANINHLELEPMGIGQGLRTKINANIGCSSLRGGVEEEIEKMVFAVKSGADTVMDLSTGPYINEIRNAIIRNSPVPVGTVPIYEAFERVNGDLEKISWELFRDVLIQQAEQGVDYFTIHSAILRDHLPLVKKRLAGIVSRGGAIIARWMEENNEENFTYTHWEEICEILSRYDIAVSIGDGLRPGCIFDANDEAQFAELRVQSELAKIADKYDVQVMHEGPGHIPIHKVVENIEIQREVCNEAPFYTLGPVVTDLAPGYDHLCSAIGASIIGASGTAMLCYVTPKEHIGLPNKEDVREGVIAFKISAHTADIAKGYPWALFRDYLMTVARVRFLWKDQFLLSLDPEKAEKYFLESNSCPHIEMGTQNYCTMCGPKFCAMRLSQSLR